MFGLFECVSGFLGCVLGLHECVSGFFGCVLGLMDLSSGLNGFTSARNFLHPSRQDAHLKVCDMGFGAFLMHFRASRMHFRVD